MEAKTFEPSETQGEERAGTHGVPLSIGYVVRMFPQTSETFIVNEIGELQRNGADVQIFSCRNPVEDVPHENVRQLSMSCAYLPDRLYSHVPALTKCVVVQALTHPARFGRTLRFAVSQSWHRKRLDLLKRFVQANALAREVSKTDVTHLHAHFAHSATQVTMLTSRLTGLGFSFTAHARDIFSNDVDYSLMREQLTSAEFAITVSEYNKAFLIDRTDEEAAENLHVIYNGVDLQKFRPDQTVARDPLLVLAVGRLVEKKGFTNLLSAIEILRDRGLRVRCEIIGDGERRKSLLREIEAKNLDGVVTLNGVRSQEELASFYRRAGVVAMPAVKASDGNQDALPTVLLEAMACGTPVVASRLTGIPEIIDDGENGVLVEPGDPLALANAIARVISDDGLQESFGASARTKAEGTFDLKKNVRVLRDHLETAHLTSEAHQ